MGSGHRTALVRICDPAGRQRGTGFVADDRGTVVTSHEAVAGATRLVLYATDGRSCCVEAAGITELPDLDLALLRTGGLSVLGVEPTPIASRNRIEPGAYVTIAAHGRREARVLGTTPVTYTAHGRTHRIGAAMELALGTDGRDALRLGGAAVGGPVADPESGAVIAVLGTALRAGHPAAGLAVPLQIAGAGSPLDALLRRNATGVPGYGRDLNLAGALHLTAMSLGSADGPASCPDPVERPDVVAEFTAFTAPGHPSPAPYGPAVVLGLVGAPGTGRTTELAALAARRALGSVPAPTLWLRGADLLADDTSVADAIARVLRRSSRIAGAAGARGDLASATPERVARLAEESGSPLLVLLDGPEEMPPVLAHGLARWTAGTVGWLRGNGARLVVACTPEHWETAGAFCPPGALHHPARPAGRLPSAVRLGDFTASQAERARERYAIPPDALTPGHDRHPLTLRLLAEVREALPGDVAGQPGTDDVFGAHLDLMCLRVAVRIAAVSGTAPGGTAVRRLAARVAGQIHEAARRCLGPGQGELDGAAFEEVFPWRTGWASAVLTEGLLVPAGTGYRFAHEELGDWVQGAHLDLDAALHALVHRWHAEERAGEELTSGTGARVASPASEPRVPQPRRPRAGRGRGTVAEAGAVKGPRVGRGWKPAPEPAVEAAAKKRRDGGSRVPAADAAAEAEAGAGARRGFGCAPEPGVRPGAEGRAARGGVPVRDGAVAGRVEAGISRVPGPEAGGRGGVPAGDGAVTAGARGGFGSAPGLEAGAVETWRAGDGRALAPDAVAEAGTQEGLSRAIEPRVGRGHVTVRDAAAEAGPGAGAAAGPQGELGGLPAPAAGPRILPVPRHRSGPVIQALLLLGRRRGPGALAHRLADLIEALDRLSPGPEARADVPHDARWWAAHLLSETLLRVPDARPHLGVLRLLAGRVVRRAGSPGAYAEFGPWFWRRLRLPEADRIDLLRRLVPADGPRRADPRGEGDRICDAHDDGDGRERFLDAVARRLAAQPRTVQPLLCDWFGDERPLPAEEGLAMRPTVADAAQALLYARRDLAVDDLTDALVSTAHPRAEELLTALAEDEPSALCRAVDRWSRDEDRPARRAAAASYAPVTAAHVTLDADRGLLRGAALALLSRPADASLHGAALTLLVQDPLSRDRHLPQALRAFVAGEPHLPAGALVAALPSHSRQVLTALRERLTRPDDGAGEVLCSLAGIDAPALALHTAGLVRAYIDSHPDDTVHAAAYIDRRLEHGPAARALLLPLVTGLLRDRPVPPPVRGALAGVLAAPGSPASGQLREELLEVLLDFEQGAHRDPAVLDALLRAAAAGSGARAPARTRALVHRTGMLLVRTPDGAVRFDRGLVELARDVPGFAALVTGWLADAPQEWAALVGPCARRTVEALASPKTMPMRAAGREHGSLRPA
ncbi:trypsin-like peptidase domain-containing protein [Streptomyces sp. NPDC087849]|uniref:trypsin-like peptidase domain-containing protein n=1 Tax=Streptomyces sp. NPDC087849 TaxID=3365808 RepID=UPI00382EA519